MKNNYNIYEDIIIIDATYRVNKYALPLVIFSGFTYSGRNCLFGIGIVNDEKEKTYEWIFKNYFQLHNHKYPRIIVSDQDASILAVVAKCYTKFIKYYFHCSWHVIRI